MNGRSYTAYEWRQAFDNFAHALTVITEDHRMVHDGFFFTATRRVAILADEAELNVLLSVPANTYPHLQSSSIRADEGGFTVRLFEDTITSDDGGTIVPVNRNRNSALTLATVLTHTPTIISNGWGLENVFVPSSGAAIGAMSAIRDDRVEWILKPSTKYLFQITNDSGGARDVQVIFGIYEIGEHVD